MKPFNLKEAKAGKPVCTREGNPARIICFNAKGNYPVIALVQYKDRDREYPLSYTNDGMFEANKQESLRDLMMGGNKRKGWINIYRKDSCLSITSRGSGYIYDTEKEARGSVEIHNPDYLDTIEIEWEE